MCCALCWLCLLQGYCFRHLYGGSKHASRIVHFSYFLFLPPSEFLYYLGFSHGLRPFAHHYQTPRASKHALGRLSEGDSNRTLTIIRSPVPPRHVSWDKKQKDALSVAVEEMLHQVMFLETGWIRRDECSGLTPLATSHPSPTERLPHPTDGKRYTMTFGHV